MMCRLMVIGISSAGRLSQRPTLARGSRLNDSTRRPHYGYTLASILTVAAPREAGYTHSRRPQGRLPAYPPCPPALPGETMRRSLALLLLPALAATVTALAAPEKKAAPLSMDPPHISTDQSVKYDF